MKRKIIIPLLLTTALMVSSVMPVAAEEGSQIPNSEEVQQEIPEDQESAKSQEMVEESLDSEAQEIQENVAGEEEEKSDSSVSQPEAKVFSENTEQAGSWILNSTGWWFAYEDGTWPSNGIYQINGMNYAFDAAGYMVTGWYQNSDGWYYFSGSGAMVTGWQLVGGVWYYLDGADAEYPGLMVSSCRKEIGGQTYFFQSSGAMYTGWALMPEGWYYADGNGALVTGWQLIGGVWYYLDGADETYPGLMASGGWYLINGSWYYLNENGSMMFGWLLLGDTWYYLGSDGAMKTGWHQIGEAWYYFYKENDPNGGNHGAMAVNVTIDGWDILENGVAVQDLQTKLDEIKQYIYVPYRYGGTTPSGWDCSGFTQWALYYLGGISIPRTTTLQAAGGTNIDKNHMELWKPGDVLVYQSGSSFTHVALYLGVGLLMHAINPKYGTMIQGVEYYEQWDSGNYLALVRRYL